MSGGWWVLSEDQLLAAFRRVAAGEPPDVVMAEMVADSDEFDPEHGRLA